MITAARSRSTLEVPESRVFVHPSGGFVHQPLQLPGVGLRNRGAGQHSGDGGAIRMQGKGYTRPPAYSFEGAFPYDHPQVRMTIALDGVQHGHVHVENRVSES